jgi:hypothetical protein
MRGVLGRAENGHRREPDMDPTALRDYFLLLAAGERETLYREAVKGLPYDIVIVDGILPLLTGCIQEPPLAVLIDAPSAARIGAALVNPLFELHMKWPVMRCTTRPDGGVNVMSSSPDRQGTLSEALPAIIAGDPTWLPPWKRRYVRVDVQCRARMRFTGEDRWRQCNCLNLSRHGAFVVSYEPSTIGDTLELEVWDIAEKPAYAKAKVVRMRKWDDGPKLPGVGVDFDAGTATHELSRLLMTRLASSLLTL